MGKLAITWPLGWKFVTSVIVSVRTFERVASNLESGEWYLSEDVWKRLEEQARPEEVYIA